MARQHELFLLFNPRSIAKRHFFVAEQSVPASSGWFAHVLDASAPLLLFDANSIYCVIYICGKTLFANVKAKKQVAGTESTRRLELFLGIRFRLLADIKAPIRVMPGEAEYHHSTVTDLARFRGLSTSVPFCSATW